MIACCGLDCTECKAFKATLAKDSERKEQLAKQWGEGLTVEFTLGDIDCNGCKSDVLSGWCRKICRIRPCAEERKVKTCAFCGDYPCEKLEEFLSKDSQGAMARENLERIRKTLRL
jgi:hypothetical protein